ncbi:hypothetical protein ACIPPJ_15690 [Streptomyces sp. NPDC086091]|uniref:hypothetical protein n=1 Tax=Streptomyces sp. NPDC086091 TaxID=3365751 RepID=UPI0037FC648D
MTAFGAFRERHYEPYLRYAALRIGQSDAAERVVSDAFTELAVTWTVALGSAGPAAVAWDILHDHIGQALAGRGHPDRSDGPARSLPLEAQVLHRRLRLSSERVAEVLGISPGVVPGLLPRSAPLKE